MSEMPSGGKKKFKYLSDIDPLGDDLGTVLRLSLHRHQDGGDDSIRDGVELFDGGDDGGRIAIARFVAPRPHRA